MSEIKPDNGFLQGQILNDKFYSSFMFDCRRCNKKYIYFQEDIPSKLLSHDFLSFEIFCCWSSCW